MGVSQGLIRIIGDASYFLRIGKEADYIPWGRYKSNLCSARQTRDGNNFSGGGWAGRLCSTRFGSWKKQADQSPRRDRCNFHLSNLEMLHPLKVDTSMRRRLGVD